MARLRFSYREITGALENKLGLPFRSGKERIAWYVVDNVQRLRVRAPKVHKGDIPVGTLNSIRRDLQLTSPQFGDLVKCPMSSGDFEQLVRQKIGEGRL